jgi:Zn-dependent M28 family amino/carboxypeptidase
MHATSSAPRAAGPSARRVRRHALVIPLVIALAVPAAAQERAPHNDAITAPKLRADLMFLAGDGFRGRLTNTPENELATEWVKSRFESFGLKPIGPGGSYFMPYNLATATLGSGNELEVAMSGGTARYGVGSDFYPHRSSIPAKVSAPLVFAGFGISAPSLGFDDLAGDVKGKILLVIDHEPGETDPNSPFDGVVTSEYSNQLKKTLAAQAHGAVGVLFVADVHNHPGPENFEAGMRFYWPEQAPAIERYLLGAWAERVRIPAAQISVALAESMLRGSGKSLLELARASESKRGSAAIPLTGTTVTLTTNVQRHVVRDRNVVAALEGSDPTLKDEWIIISGHPDHDGARGEQIFNGADDNGSGTVGLVAIAEAYAMAAAEGKRPKRSILFASFNSEERGLLGAWAFTEAPLVPLDRIVAVLNMDMIGRNEEVPEGGGARFRGLPVQTAESNNNSVTLLGWTRSASLTSAVEKANGSYALTLKKNYDNNTSNLLRRSDHWPFLQHGVPAIWFHTGLHPDYHLATDRPEKINYAKMEKIARLVHQVSWDLSQAASRPRISADGAR